MPKGHSHKEKLLRLLSILYEHTDAQEGITMSEILEELEGYGLPSERKSIYKDLEKLNNMGFETKKVKQGSKVYYHFLSHPFSLSELKLLVDAINASSVLSENTSKTLTRKLSTLTSKDNAKKLKRVVFSNKYTKTHNDHLFKLLDTLYDAMDHNQSINLRYTSWSMEKTLVDRNKVYHLSPWALIWNDENYYLLAYDHNAETYKHFRVDKIRSITLNKDKREHPLEDISGYIHKHFNMYGGEEVALTLRFPKELIGVFIDRFGTGVSLFELEDGRVEIMVHVVLSDQFFGWLFGLGAGVEILKPLEVRERYKKQLEEALTLLKE